MEKEISEIINICDQLLKVPACSGYEFPLLNYLEKRIQEAGYNTFKGDEFLAVEPEENGDIIFSTHIDRHGLVKNEDNEVEYIAFYLRRKLGLEFTRDEVEKEEYNVESIIKSCLDTKLTDNYIVFDNNGKKSKFIRKGSPYEFEITSFRHTREPITSYNSKTGEVISNYTTICGFTQAKENKVSFMLDKDPSSEEDIFTMDTSLSTLNNSYLSGQIDNVISSAVLLYLLENTNFPHKIIFTRMEEIGLSWRGVLEYSKYKSIKDKSLLVLDTSPYNNINSYQEGFLTTREGDERANFDTTLVRFIKETLEKENIPSDMKPSYEGRTEMGKIHKESHGEVNGATLQLPTMNYHTSYETCSITSLKNYYKLISNLSKTNKI